MGKHNKIFIGLIAGVVLGGLCNYFFPGSSQLDWVISKITQPFGQIFLRIIFMVVVPLVFSSLVLGILELGDIRRLGRVGMKTLIYTVIASSISVVVGITLVNLMKPGVDIDPSVTQYLQSSLSSQSQKTIENANNAKPFVDTIISLIPKNPLDSAVNALNGEMIALMIFALFFGVALALIRSAKTEPFISGLETIQQVSMKIVDFAMALAPYGVAALLFSLTARFGFDIVQKLGKYMLVVILGLAFQQFVVYSLILRYGAKISPRLFFSRIREVMLTAFSTASSNVTLPTTLRVSEENLGIAKRISSFVLTVGSTANQNGTALFEGVTILFLAQVFGVDLSLNQQIVVVVMSILAGVGTAGVPGGSLPLIVIVLQSVGIPGEGIGIILGVDRLLDMCRTVLNVTGDIVAAAVIARSESALFVPDEEKLEQLQLTTAKTSS